MNKLENLENNEKFKGNSINSVDLDSLMKNYILSESIPEIQTKSIFDKIENRYKKSKNFLKSSSGLIFSFIPSCFESILKSVSFLTVSTMLIFVNYPANIKQEIKNYKFKNIITKKSISKDIPTISSYEIKHNNMNEIQDAAENKEANSINKFNQDESQESFNFLNISGFSENIIINPCFNKPIEYTNNNFIPNTEISEKAQFFYECRINKFSGLTYKNQNAPEQAIMKDCSFGLWYNISPIVSAGAEFRQESFTLKTTAANMISDSNHAINMTCWELGIKFRPEIFIYESRPFLQFNLGGGKSGMITRLSAGLTIPITDKFNIITGAEINSLIYSSKSNITTTNRIGLNIGFNLDLK